MRTTSLVVIVIALLSLGTLTQAQETLSLDSAIDKAYEHFAFQRQIEVTNDVTATHVDRHGKSYLPSLDLNAMSTYQNAQISIPVAVNIPGFEPPAAPLNLNTALFTIRQWIYDGSTTHHQQLIEEASGKAELLAIEVQRLDVKTSVMQQFFAVLLAEKHLEILVDKKRVLKERFDEVSSAVSHHFLLQSDADLLEAEIIRLDQSITETTYTRKQHLRALAQLMGSPLQDNVQLTEPQAQQTSVTDLGGRPDLLLLDSRMDELEARKGAISSQYLPRIGAFADIGVGLPGYDIFDDSPALMAKAGITLNWHIFDWGKGSLQEQTLDLSQELLSLRKQQMISQISVQTEAQRTAIEKAEELLKTDQGLIRLYTSAANAYAVQLTNGTITSAEYITQINKQEAAETNMELHRLQRLIATMNYNTMLGQ